MHIKLRHFDYMPKQMVKLTNLTVTHRPWLVKSTTFCSKKQKIGGRQCFFNTNINDLF